MKTIQMVDLHSQYLSIQEEIDGAIARVLSSSRFIRGEEVEAFETELAEYLGVKHVISCGNGTDALQLALMALDYEPGDEIITPDFTFFATAEVIALLGLKPVPVEVTYDSFTISPNAIRRALTKRTKAILPVHLFGQAADMRQILNIAKGHSLDVVEDNAQALGAEVQVGSQWHKTGTVGRVGTTSFFPSKPLGCFGDGGAVYTNDDELADRVRTLANHGMTRRYHHERIGINSRLDALQAAILRVKLKYLDQWNAKRREIAMRYTQGLAYLPELGIPTIENYSYHVYHQYTLKCVTPELRDNLKEELKAKGIPSMVYYPKPISAQKAMRPHIASIPSNKVTQQLCETVLSLPICPELSAQQQDYIVSTLAQLVERHSNHVCV